MTHPNNVSPRKRVPAHRPTTTQRLRLAIGFALARGAAHATGAGLVGLLFWWITHH